MKKTTLFLFILIGYNLNAHSQIEKFKGVWYSQLYGERTYSDTISITNNNGVINVDFYGNMWKSASATGYLSDNILTLKGLKYAIDGSPMMHENPKEDLIFYQPMSNILVYYGREFLRVN